MNDARSIPALATAAVTLAAAAPVLAIGAAIGLGLLWLFRDDDRTQTATATPGNEPPAPDAKRQNAGWFFEWWEPEAPAAPPVTQTMSDAERQQRIQDNEAELARLKRKLVTRQATPSPATSPRSVLPKSVSSVVTPPRDSATAAAPRCVTPAPSSATALTAATAPRDAAPMVALGPATAQAVPGQTSPARRLPFAPRASREIPVNAARKHGLGASYP